MLMCFTMEMSNAYRFMFKVGKLRQSFLIIVSRNDEFEVIGTI